MKLERFKERDNKRIGIIVFTILCILLVSGVILYRTFAIFEVKTNQNVINGNVQSMGDLEFAFYKEVDGKDTIVKEVPKKEEGYSLDTSSSYCVDLLNDKQVSTVNWDYENWEVRVKNISTTKTKCYLHFKQIYVEKELNGAIPDLGNGRLIPVQIKEEKPTEITIQNIGDGSYGGKVVKADITQEWYKYGEQRWANAVILKDGKIDDYALGDEILESDIESYFVWIPRYRYKLFANNPDQYTATHTLGNINSSNPEDLNKIPNNPPKIEIVFETKSAGIMNDGSYMTHPAFTSFNSDGLWIGKFETGIIGATSETEAKQNMRAQEKVQIKPNVYSWRDIQVANAFYTSYDYQRDLESHMMKNMEWGAVAYLASSKYGLCSGDACTNIMFNNNSNYVTGYASTTQPTCGLTGTNEECNRCEVVEYNKNGIYTYNYFDTRSQTASTTGNYSGVYDMAGGTAEYVMGVMQAGQDDATPASGSSSRYNSGFNGKYTCLSVNCTTETELTNGQTWPSSKYYDLYEYSTSVEQYQRGKLGDGTKEFGPFSKVYYEKITTAPGQYSNNRRMSSYCWDYAWFIYSEYPWIIRGGLAVNGSETGLMAFGRDTGSNDYEMTFRVVLTP